MYGCVVLVRERERVLVLVRVRVPCAVCARGAGEEGVEAHSTCLRPQRAHCSCAYYARLFPEQGAHARQRSCATHDLGFTSQLVHAIFISFHMVYIVVGVGTLSAAVALLLESQAIVRHI